MVLVGYGALMNPATPPLLRRRPGRPRGGTPVANRDTLVAAAVSTARRHGADTTMDDIAATATLQEATQTHAVMQLGRIDIRI